MRKVYFKTDMTKIRLSFLLIVLAFAISISSAHASIPYPMFRKNADIIKFTQKLIYESLYHQNEASSDEKKSTYHKNKKTRIKFMDLAKLTEKEAENE